MDEFNTNYNNGYNQAIKDFELKLKKKIDDNSKWFGRFYKFSVFEAIDKIADELTKKEN